jgi:RNA polymerase sigma factor (sigma-70 family)
MGDGASSRHTHSSLTQGSFERLLLSLDPDRDRAGEQYELIRRKLVKFFECRASPSPEDDADEAITRVAKRIGDGETILNLRAYFYGVARLVLLEAGREQRREMALPAVVHEPPSVDDARESEARLGCLEHCLDAMPVASRELIVSYYQGDNSSRIRQRHQLAAAHDIPMNALRIRMHRLRTKLENCMGHCLARTAG